MTSKTFSPNAATSFWAKWGPTPLMTPLPRYFSMPSGVDGARGHLLALELPAVLAVDDPFAGRVEELAGGHARRVADDCRQLAHALGLHAQDAEAVLLVVERHALHDPGEGLGHPGIIGNRGAGSEKREVD